ncbi:MAG: transglycosylase SLT domain-containing protein [Sulfitobacter sp.]
MQGKGVWFETENEAKAFVREKMGHGARSFDVGCFQINYKWHGQAFASVEDMFDPVLNARYAAKFIASLHRELGDWSKAAGAYHSRTEKYANKYIARFNEIYATQSEFADGITQVSENQSHTNSFPLLRVQARKPHLGSLVPLGSSAALNLFAPRGKN